MMSERQQQSKKCSKRRSDSQLKQDPVDVYGAAASKKSRSQLFGNPPIKTECLNDETDLQQCANSLSSQALPANCSELTKAEPDGEWEFVGSQSAIDEVDANESRTSSPSRSYAFDEPPTRRSRQSADMRCSRQLFSKYIVENDEANSSTAKNGDGMEAGTVSTLGSSVDDRMVFCVVPGRLCLISSSAKYKVTVGEVRRRIGEPECLNASLLGGVLRRAKAKDGSKSLRDQLSAVGIRLESGRRTTAEVNTFTSLVENEAARLATDFRLISHENFPYRELALRLTTGDVSTRRKRREKLATASAFLTEFRDLIVGPGDSPILKNLSLSTHGFGPSIVTTVIDLMNRSVTDALTQLESNNF